MYSRDHPTRLYDKVYNSDYETETSIFRSRGNPPSIKWIPHKLHGMTTETMHIFTES